MGRFSNFFALKFETARARRMMNFPTNFPGRNNFHRPKSNEIPIRSSPCSVQSRSRCTHCTFVDMLVTGYHAPGLIARTDGRRRRRRLMSYSRYSIGFPVDCLRYLPYRMRTVIALSPVRRL